MVALGSMAFPGVARADIDSYGSDPNVLSGSREEICQGFRSGTAELKTFFDNQWPALASIGGYVCREINQGSAPCDGEFSPSYSTCWSTHAAGRALDLMVGTNTALGNEIVNWLLASRAGYAHYYARVMGVQQILWNDHCWDSQVSGDRSVVTVSAMRSCDVEHYDHPHVTLSNAGSLGQTSWFGPVAAPSSSLVTPGVVRGDTWYLRNSNSSGSSNIDFGYGDAGHYHLVGDWNGDGIDTPGEVRAEGGQLRWYLRNSNNGGPADVQFTYGLVGDKPVVGNWDGSGGDGIGVVRGAQWNLRQTPSGGAGQIIFSYGTTTDTPVAGDWDGNGTDTPGVFRAPNNWYLRNSLSGGSAHISLGFGQTGEGDKPIVGDWNGDGIDTVGVTRPNASGQWEWLQRDANVSGPATRIFTYGLTTDQPIAGDWIS
jgi:hypothetical protein